MITLKEAMDKAGISTDMFQSNDYKIFSHFPLMEKWREKYQSVGMSFMTNYKYERAFRSDPLNRWREKQNQDVISFLKMVSKNKLYAVPYVQCCKYLEAWIAYDPDYCKFILRINPMLLGEPDTGSLARRIIKESGLGIKPDGSLSMIELLSKVPDSKIPAIFSKLFGNTIVPVEKFDPVSCMNQIISSNMVTIEPQAKYMDKSDKKWLDALFASVSDELYVYRMNIQNIVLFATCTRLSLLDPYNLLEKEGEVWANLICFKFTNGTKFMIM